jgi:hypothetical protein
LFARFTSVFVATLAVAQTATASAPAAPQSTAAREKSKRATGDYEQPATLE